MHPGATQSTLPREQLLQENPQHSQESFALHVPLLFVYILHNFKTEYL